MNENSHITRITGTPPGVSNSSLEPLDSYVAPLSDHDVDMLNPTGTRSRRSSSITAPSDNLGQILPPIETRLRSSTNPLLGVEDQEDQDPDTAVESGMNVSGLMESAPPGVGLASGLSMTLPTIVEGSNDKAFSGAHQQHEQQHEPRTIPSPISPLEIAPAEQTHISTPTSLSDRAFTYLRYLLSSTLSVAYLGYIFWGILTGQAVLPGPAVAHLFVFLFSLLLMAYLEGLKIAILAVEKHSPESRRLTHPRAYALMTAVREGNTVERFLVGRQFVTIFIMTLIAQVTSFPGISDMGISGFLWFVVVQTGMPGAMVVTTVGSLQPQLLAAKDPWRFLNMYGSQSVLKLCCGAEATGICTHFAWILIELLRWTVFVSDRPTKATSDLSAGARAYEAVKYIVSTAVVVLSVSFLMFGVWTGEAILPLPPVGVFCTLAFCFVSLSFLEGLQVAVLVTEGENIDAFRCSHPRAHALMRKATFAKNVRRFLVGRQFFVVFIVFLVNQCTIFPYITHFGMGDVAWLVLVQLGLPTALSVLCFAQLPAQLLANQDPRLFMNRPGPTLTLELCFMMELTGLVHFAWVLAAVSRATWFRQGAGTPSTGAGANPNVPGLGLGLASQGSYSDLRSGSLGALGVTDASSRDALNEIIESSTSAPDPHGDDDDESVGMELELELELGLESM